MMHDATLQLLTAPQLPKGTADDSDQKPGAVMADQRRTTDLSKTSVPLPFMLTIIATVVAIAAGVWRIDSRVSVIDARYQMQKELDAERAKYIDQRFEVVEAKIESAGLRNAAMSLSQELAKANDQLKNQR